MKYLQFNGVLLENDWFFFVNGILSNFISLFLHVVLGKPGYAQDQEVFDF